MARVFLSLTDCSILSPANNQILGIKGKTAKERLKNKKTWENLKVKTVEDKLITLYCIAFPGSKVSQNDCTSRMWNMSYKYKNMCTV
jgi:hypothetical protein